MKEKATFIFVVCGITWSVAHLISTGANDQRRHQVITGMKWIANGALIQPCDATPGGNIRGIHAGIVELHDGRWMALVRGNNIEGCMPMSIPNDEGRTWPHVKLITPGGITALFRPAPLRKGLDMMSNAANRPIAVNKNF